MSILSVREAPGDVFVEKYAAHLKKQGKLDLPSWVEYAKTGVARELAPLSEDWYYIRAASIARKIYLKKGTGVGALQCVYGGSYRKGVRTEHFRKAAGGHIRHILQNLEKIGVVETLKKGGRGITRAGQRDLDRIAGEC